MFFLIPQGLEAFKLPLKKSLVNLALDSTNERHIYEIIAPSAKVNRRRSLANGRHEIFVAPQSVCPWTTWLMLQAAVIISSGFLWFLQLPETWHQTREQTVGEFFCYCLLHQLFKWFDGNQIPNIMSLSALKVPRVDPAFLLDSVFLLELWLIHQVHKWHSFPFLFPNVNLLSLGKEKHILAKSITD